MFNLINLLAGNLTPTTENFKEALAVMGKGLLGIFIVIAILVLGVTILNKVTSPKEKNDENKGE